MKRNKSCLPGYRVARNHLEHHVKGLAPLRASTVQLCGMAGDDIELIGVANELLQSIEKAEAGVATTLKALRARLGVKP